MSDLLNRSIFALSSGEKQQIAIGSVYALSPKVYIFDEPAANLDYAAAQRLAKTMKGLKEATVSALGKFFDGTWADIGGKVETLNLQAGDYVGLPTAEASWGFKTFTMDEYNKLIEDIRSGALTVSAEIADHPAVDASVTVNYID